MLESIIAVATVIGFMVACFIISQLHFAGNVYRYAQTYNYWACGSRKIGGRFLWTPVKPTLIPWIYWTDRTRQPMRLDAEGFIHVFCERLED